MTEIVVQHIWREEGWSFLVVYLLRYFICFMVRTVMNFSLLSEIATVFYVKKLHINVQNTTEINGIVKVQQHTD